MEVTMPEALHLLAFAYGLAVWTGTLWLLLTSA
jgi:hypothetical protein